MRVKELFLVTVRLLKAAVFVASFLLWEKRTTAWFDFAFGVRSKQWLVGEPYQLPISDETNRSGHCTSVLEENVRAE